MLPEDLTRHRVSRRQFLNLAAAGSALALQPKKAATKQQPKFVRLSNSHLAAVNRRRRISVNNDVGGLTWFGVDHKKWVHARFGLFDKPGCHVDSVSWCLDEGNLVGYPSKLAPLLNGPGLRKWLDAGIDILKVIVEESKKRGLECFYTYRLNGTDVEADGRTPAYPPMKMRHPDWVHTGEASKWWPVPRWNFAVPEVRQYKLAILRELAENYDFDGLDVDFSRAPYSLPFQSQWRHRDAMTDFVRSVRWMLQDEAKRRGKPCLLSVRVPDSLAGCHFDGLDIGAWVQENLIDIINTGGRSFEVDLDSFRRVIGGTKIKLVPSIDDFHSSDGYRQHSAEFLRGVFSNYWHQGADWVQTFNFVANMPGAATAFGRPQDEVDPSHCHLQALFEIGDPDAMRLRDKIYAIQRRFGQGISSWDVYEAANHTAQLPVTLPAPESVTWRTVDRTKWLRLYVSDDLRANADRIKSVELKTWLTGETAESAVVETKLNGILLTPGGWQPDPIMKHGDIQPYTVKTPAAAPQTDGWRTYTVRPEDLAVGTNLITVRLAEKPGGQKPVVVQKVEVHLVYQRP